MSRNVKAKARNINDDFLREVETELDNIMLLNAFLGEAVTRVNRPLTKDDGYLCGAELVFGHQNDRITALTERVQAARQAGGERSGP